MERLSSLFLCCLLSLLYACAPQSEHSNNRKKKVVATTGMVADMARNVLGDLVDIQVLMGPGVDPHLYKASQGDMNTLSEADIILYSGLHLEGKMVEVLHKIGRNKPVLAIGDYVWENRLQYAGDGSKTIDPHVWMDPSSWIYGVDGVTDSLLHLFPNDTTVIGKNFRSYRDTLEKVNEEIFATIQSIPEKQRMLITSHDAFRYFGLVNNIEVHGLQGISTVSEYGLQDVSNMVNMLVNRKIKAVFVESSVSQKSLQAVIEGCESKGHRVNIGGTLFSDSMGKDGTPEGTYKGMLRHNARTIAKALR